MKTQIKKIVPKAQREQLKEVGYRVQGYYRRTLYKTINRLAGGTANAIALMHRDVSLTPDTIIRAYAYGIFPIPQANGKSTWHDPDPRVTIPIDGYHVGKRLRSYVRKQMFEITFDQDFGGVLDGCSETKEGREETWITPAVKEVYMELHRMGVSHSVEAWKDGELVGGLMGVSIGAFFATESLFYREPQASKIAYTHLCASLKRGGYKLHDMQMESGVSNQFGQVFMPRDEYKQRLSEAIVASATFAQMPTQEVIDTL